MNVRAAAIGAMGAALCALAPADVVTVYVYNFEFSTDATLSTAIDPVIQPGDTIRWEWVDLGHNVKSVSESPEVFDSGFPSEVGATFEHTFNTPGTFWYYCTPHGFEVGDGTAQGMAGTVTVVPEPATMAALGLGLAAVLRARRKR